MSLAVPSSSAYGHGARSWGHPANGCTPLCSRGRRVQCSTTHRCHGCEHASIHAVAGGGGPTPCCGWEREPAMATHHSYALRLRPKAMATPHGYAPWLRPMATPLGYAPWIRPLDTPHGYAPWLRPLATPHGYAWPPRLGREPAACAVQCPPPQDPPVAPAPAAALAASGLRLTLSCRLRVHP